MNMQTSLELIGWDQIATVRGEQDRICSAAKNTGYIPGDALFPAQVERQTHRVQMIGWTEGVTPFNSRKPAILTGCVTYVSSLDNRTIYQTGFFYAVYRVDEQSFDEDGPDSPIGGLNMRRVNDFGGAAGNFAY